MDLDRGVPPTPDDYKTLVNSSSEIYVFSGSDQQYNLREKLDLEWQNVPLRNPRLAEDVDGQQDISQRIALVYVTEFFTDACDFIYYVKGGKNMSKFMAGTFSGKGYDGPSFATPCIVFNTKEVFESTGLDLIQFEKVSKRETKGLRWKYLYLSAVKAWENLDFDWDKLEALRKRAEEDAQAGDKMMEIRKSLKGDDAEASPSPATEEDMEDLALSPQDTASTNPTTPDDSKVDMGEYETVEESDMDVIDEVENMALSNVED